MRAGSLREFLDFRELVQVQKPSGAIKQEWESVYQCRAYLKKSSPVYDKDGVDAKELYQGTNRYFIIRRTDKVTEKQRIYWNGGAYSILLIQPNIDDNTLLLQVRQLND